MISKSHTEEEILQAFSEGKKVYDLDSATSGHDDVLIGETMEEIEQLLCDHFDLAEFPETWTLTEVTKEEVQALL